MTLQSFLMYVSLWRENIPLAKLRKESQLTLQRHRVSRAAALLRGLPSEPLAWEMLLSRVFWLQRVRQSLLRSVLLRYGGQPILHLSSSEWRQYSLIHPPQTYCIPSLYILHYASCPFFIFGQIGLSGQYVLKISVVLLNYTVLHFHSLACL